ncbi:hypothetical protein [Staphylococcus equorum]|uniref:hypothetical protein n=1 Tax=Staphylococcus equorum TaxID=246432 RepID=UPI000852BD45|nr:hypothetical protein [Staphylococcus equorum]OEK55956.1 hypothetical protein ASS97_08270 [Staphylococcus equorum]OEK62804.1 hypothetical protein ASS99_07800 [Staphylococcus equorum]OEK64189.1 hypothetical protein ASS98_05355 [Staphylococcus equorum]
MAYEYECEEVIKNVIKELIYFKKGKNELAEKEIDEIYAKAKAFDEISNMLKQREYYDRDTALDVVEIVDEFEEDNQ